MDYKRKIKQINRKNRETHTRESLYFNKGNGQWGYYLNVDIEKVIDYLNKNNLKTVVDLGAGEGHIVELLNEMGFQAKGYEIEDVLIENYNKEFGKGNVTKKDIMYLTVEDIKEFEVIYFYQPFKDIGLMDNFLTNLKNVMTNQTYIFQSDGYRKRNLEIFKKD